MIYIFSNPLNIVQFLYVCSLVRLSIDMYFNLMKEMYFFVFSSFCLGYGHARNESLRSSPCQNSITRYTWNLCCTEKIFQETVSAIFYYISHIFFMAAITSRYSSVYIYFFRRNVLHCIFLGRQKLLKQGRADRDNREGNEADEGEGPRLKERQ